MRVVVVGGGIVGLCCAYELADAGADVIVLERRSAGAGASRGNTGWVCPSFSYPLPGPGIIREGLRGMVRGGGPLAIRPTLDPTFLRWLLGFRRSAGRTRWEAGVRALIALNRRTLELFDRYEASGIAFEMHRSGLLLVATTEVGLASYTNLFAELRRLGFSGQTTALNGVEAREREPSLAAERLCGGVHAVVDRYVRPESLLEGIGNELRARGVEIREHVAVAEIAATDGNVLLRTDGGDVEADRAVVAAGASSPPLLRKLGVSLPLVPARGYSFTFAGEGLRPRHALYLAEAKVGISAYAHSVRVAGVFELGHAGEDVDVRRLGAMLVSVEPYFEDWQPSREQPLLEWAGLRPMTADGLPMIGRAPALEHVFIATGHGMLGVTLAPATAALLTPLVLEGRSAPELEPFDPARRV